MLEVDDVVLDQRVVLDLFELEDEFPRHRDGHLFLDGEVHEVSDAFVYA